MSRAEPKGSGPYWVVTPEGRVVAPRVRRADSLQARFFGLMGRASLADGEGLWLEPSSGIHMFFMRIAIDAAFVDRAGRVLRVCHDLRPWRLGRFLVVPGSRATIEVAAGTLGAAGVRPGDQLRLIPATQPAAARIAAIPHPLTDATLPGGSS
ncbi:MAG TPA: DUF192 domain-containing protein [Verrucomicrobiae bacterium]|nr:DUF192 domain-containing protein [Verrucomicrobiae bacterium]